MEESFNSALRAFQANPLVFTIGLGVLIPVVWGAAWLYFRSTLSGKDERISALKERVDAYEKRLGKSPEEALSRVEALERNANLTLGPPWRTLKGHELNRLSAAIAPLQKQRVQVMYSNHLGRSLAQQFADAFVQNGWTLAQPVGEGGGLGYGVSTGRGVGLPHDLKQAIEQSTDFVARVQGRDEAQWGDLVFVAVGINANEDGTAPHVTQI